MIVEFCQSWTAFFCITIITNLIVIIMIIKQTNHLRRFNQRQQCLSLTSVLSCSTVLCNKFAGFWMKPIVLGCALTCVRCPLKALSRIHLECQSTWSQVSMLIFNYALMTKTKPETQMEYHLKENIVFKSLIKRSINQKRERSNSTFCTLNWRVHE